MDKWCRKMKFMHRCITCGKSDEKTLAGKVRCKNCTKKYKDNRIRNLALKNKIVKKESNTKRIYKIARLADKEGLTYGEYIAKPNK